MIDWLSPRLVQYRYLLFLLSLLVLGFLSLGFQNLKMDTDYKVFFNKDNPQRMAFEFIQDTFTKGDGVLFVIAPENKNVFTHENLSIVEEMTELAWQLPYSTRVDSLANFQHTYAEGDDLIVEDLYENAGALTSEDLARIKSIAVSEPILIHRLISPSGHVTAINVEMQLPDPLGDANFEAVEAARALIDQIETKHPNIKIYLTGQTLINVSFAEVGNQDMERLSMIVFITIIGLLIAMMRSLSATFVTLLIIIVGVVFTMGFTGSVGWHLNNVSAMSPVLIITLAVADCVHLLTSYLRGLRQGLNKPTAMTESLKLNMQAIFLTSFTTALGFLSMNFSDSPPFRELGTIAAVGVMGTFVFSITMLPALGMLFSFKPKKISSQESTVSLSWFANWVIQFRKPLFIGSLLVSCVFAMCIPLNDLNDDNIGYFHKSTPMRQAADFTEANLVGVNTVEYSLNSGETEGINSPEFLQKVDGFVEWARNQPEVTHVYTYIDTLKRLNKNMHNDDPSWYKLPDNRRLASQYQLLYEMSLPFGLDLTNQIDVDKSALRVTISLQHIKAKETLYFEERAQQWFQDNAPELATHGASPSIMFAHIGQKNIISMVYGTLVAIVLISFTLMLFLRSVRFGIISMFPNAIPAGIMFGLWGLLVGHVNLGAAAVYSITLGIVVDDTVHFLSKYLRARRQLNLSTEDAIRYAFEKVGWALVTTSVSLAMGFFILYFSKFDVNATMGLMIAGTIVIALVFDFIFLPTLLLLTSRWEKLESTGLAVDTSGVEPLATKQETKPDKIAPNT